MIAAAVVAGCASTPRGVEPLAKADGAGGAVQHVDMRNIKFEPSQLTVAPGATVTWTNHEAVPHTVTPADAAQWGTGGSELLGEGGTWSHTFSAPGTYTYYCKPHAGKGSDGAWRGMVGTIVVAAGGAAGGGGAGARAVPATTVVPNPAAVQRFQPSASGVVSIALEAREVEAQVADGVGYEFWTFGGTVPGPMLRVREGDKVALTLSNSPDSKQPHSIDLHAVTGPGGGAGATQVAPGEAKTFQFRALNPGLYVYHCATPHVPTHVANGMYGLILVEPAAGLPPVDREYAVMQGEVYTAGRIGEVGFQAFSLAKLLDDEPEYFLLNGRVGALTGDGALRADVGDMVRIHFGVGGFVASNFHVIGEIFDRVYPEGGFPPVSDVQTTLIPAGGAAMVEFKVEVPGTYLLVDHALVRAIDRGAAGHLVVAGFADQDVFEAGAASGGGH